MKMAYFTLLSVYQLYVGSSCYFSYLGAGYRLMFLLHYGDGNVNTTSPQCAKEMETDEALMVHQREEKDTGALRRAI